MGVASYKVSLSLASAMNSLWFVASERLPRPWSNFGLYGDISEPLNSAS